MFWTMVRLDAVVELEFNRPPRNMMSFAAMSELHQHLTGVAADPTVRAVLLMSGTPGYFVGHGDLEDLIALGQSREASGPANVWGKTFDLIERMPQPIVAAIDGQAWGGGCEIALACAVRLASDVAHFAQPEVDLGIIPGAGGTLRLARLIGLGRATEMILTGRIVEADEALAIGLVQHVFATARFRETARAWTQRLASKPFGTIEAAKAALYSSATSGGREALRQEASLFMGLQSRVETQQLQQQVLAAYDRSPSSERIELSDPAMIS